MIRLEDGQFGWDYRIVDESDDTDELIQSDWDYPATAQTFRWNIAGAHRRNCKAKNSTDGTVDCRGCDRTTSDFIGAAQNYLDRNIGRRIR